MSTPLLQDFNPKLIPWQYEAIKYYQEFDYSTGILEMLLSGSVGSAKSLEAAHLIAIHCLENKGARCLVLRRVLKDLKRTIWPTIIKHIADIPHLVKSYNKSEMKITFVNGSEIIGDSYEKGDLEKFRSLELSMVNIEEASESNKDLYDAVKMRVGRIPQVKKNLILLQTNPAEPSHYIYKYFIEPKSRPNVKVFYSLTEQNPFLPKWYIANLKRDLDPKMAKRMLLGQWISIQSEGVYYNYNPDVNYREQEYKIVQNEPIYITHDFNIGKGKPMSCALGQFINGVWHWFKSFHVEGARTNNIMEEMGDDGVFENGNLFIINGDATGESRDTRGIQSDYDIIEEYLANYKREDGSKLDYEIDVPKSNPPVRKRHNKVNASFESESGHVSLYVYDEWINQGFIQTQFLKDSFINENDSLPQQHVTTAIGYAVYREYLVGDNDSETILL